MGKSEIIKVWGAWAGSVTSFNLANISLPNVNELYYVVAIVLALLNIVLTVKNLCKKKSV